MYIYMKICVGKYVNNMYSLCDIYILYVYCRYDARLFNQSAGMDSGFGAEDGYGVYSKPMFNRGEAQSVYRPKADDGDAWGDADQQARGNHT